VHLDYFCWAEMSREDRKHFAITERELELGHLLRKIESCAHTARRLCDTEFYGLQEKADRLVYELRWLKSGDPVCPIEPDDNNGCRVLDRADRERLKAELPITVLGYLGKEYDDEPIETSWEKLFWHSDNIRFRCEIAQIPVPQWYADKYGH
jgi:hypothetical protein